MKDKLRNLILEAARRACDSGALPSAEFPPVEIEEPRNAVHGDYSTNFAMVMASVQKMPPRKIAEALTANMADAQVMLAKTEIAGPGFINFFIDPSAWLPVLRCVHAEDRRYGASDMGAGQKVQVEFVSANPTGPLHVGHGRGAAVGDAIAAILAFCGYAVEKEYYINDSGRQICTLGRSVFLRYQELFSQQPPAASDCFPEDCYQGEYIRDLAAQIGREKGRELLHGSEEAAVAYCARYASRAILVGIRDDLAAFGVRFERWFSEQSLYDDQRVEAVIEKLKAQHIVYERDGAQWFKTSAYGDEKDRVVVRRNGQTTYFASDIAYHQDKFERGFDRVIDVWGADHHGYIPRMKASIAASGIDPGRFDVILVQLVNLLRRGEPVAMSTRAGEFVTLRDVLDEVGRDAARFIFLTRHYESPLDFDLEIAKQKSNDNPVYYVQYVHARISSIARKGRERGISDVAWDPSAAALLKEPEEIQLIKTMGRYPDVVQAAARLMEPHRITFYLMNLAAAFHAYYNKHRVLTDDAALTRGRLYLVLAIQKIIRNGLNLLGVSAPETM